MPRSKQKVATGTRRRGTKLLDNLAALDAADDTPAAEAARARLREQAEAIGLRLVSMTITEEPIPDPEIESLPKAARDRIQRISRLVREDPAPLRAELEEMVKRHPRIPMLRNHLVCALQALGEHERAAAVLDETVRLFPTYVFGFANHIMILLSEDRLEEARALVETGPRGPMFMLPAFDPSRAVFHVTEVACYTAMVGHYLASTGRLDAAKDQLKMCRELLPEHPTTKSLETRLARERALANLVARTRRTLGRE